MPSVKRYRKPQSKSCKISGRTIPASEMEHAIRLRAFELFEQRNREHGRDLDDWLRAEAELHGQGA